MEVRRWAALAALTAAAVAVGCGLLGADEGQVRRWRDPYVGFTDGPSIEVCFQGTRLVSTSGGSPLSICIAKGAQAQPCTDSAECGDTERCVCGRCVTRPCVTSTDCELQEVCQGSRCTRGCSADKDCGPGEACSGGGCARTCGNASDCAFGEKCGAIDGSCIVKTCSQTVTCSGDDECVAQEDLGDLREPHLLVRGADKVAYVEVRRPAGQGKVSCAIHRARIVHGRRWEIDPIEPVLAPAPEDDGCIGAPTLLEEQGALVMYASRGNGTGIIRARSTDGVSFTREKNDVIFPRFGWENGWVGSPGAAWFQSKVVVAYEADHGRAVGIASVGEDGVAQVISWLRPDGFEDPLLWRQVDRIGAPFPIVRNDSLLIYMTVHGIEGYDAVPSGPVIPADPNDSIGLVESRDLLRWSRFPTGPIFARRTNLRAYLGEKDPAVLIDGDSSWLVYVGSDASGQSLTGMGLASTGP